MIWTNTARVLTPVARFSLELAAFLTPAEITDLEASVFCGIFHGV